MLNIMLVLLQTGHGYINGNIAGQNRISDWITVIVRTRVKTSLEFIVGRQVLPHSDAQLGDAPAECCLTY
jgi:hypothetical protein